MSTPTLDVETVPSHLRRALALAARESAERTVREMATEIRLGRRPSGASLPDYATWFGEDEPVDLHALEEAGYAAWCADLTLADRLLGQARIWADVPDDERRGFWRQDLDAAIKAQQDRLDREIRDDKARYERESAAAEMSWQDMAAALFGAEYQTPLSEVCRVARKTIQRADKPDGRIPQGIEAWLYRTMVDVPAPLRRAYGAAMRAGMADERASDGVIRAARAFESGDNLPAVWPKYLDQA